MTDRDALGRAVELLRQLDGKREQLERVGDVDEALGLFEEIHDLVRQAHAELERAKMDADARP